MVERDEPHAPPPRHARPVVVEVPDVAPGMVPRESDYVAVEPARTITTPEPAPARVEPQPQPVVFPADAPRPADEPVLVRPDVVPPEEAEWTEGKSRP